MDSNFIRSTTFTKRILRSGMLSRRIVTAAKSLFCRCITAACKNYIRLFALIVTCPFPDTDTLRTMFYSLIHCQPLMTWMFGCYDYVYIVLTSDTVIEAGKQTVSVRRQIHTYNVCFLVSDVIEESRILMCKSVVVLLPYVG